MSPLQDRNFFPSRALLSLALLADKVCMGLRRVLFVLSGWWLASSTFPRSLPLGLSAAAQSAGPGALVQVLTPKLALLGPLLASIFFTLWLRTRSREQQNLEERQQLQFALLAQTEELTRDKADLTEARDALRAHAIRDELTGLPNRTSIMEVLDREMARAVRDKSALSVVLADVDHLQKINDEHGQAGGDDVLREVGRRLEHAIRSYDAAGRYNGGEFLLVLPTFEGDTGVERLRKIHESICGKPMTVPGGSISVTCSFGVSILLPNQFYSSEELRERASQAMSTAKQDGRNRIGFFARTGG